MGSLDGWIEWANANEGLLQGLGMLASGVGAVLFALRRERRERAGRVEAADPVPSWLVVRPLAESEIARVAGLLDQLGGDVEPDGEGLRAEFPDADDAARAALRVRDAHIATAGVWIGELGTDPPTPPDAASGEGVRATARVRRALRDAHDIVAKARGAGAFPYVIDTAPSGLRSSVLRRLALPVLGVALIAFAAWSLTRDGTAPAGADPIRAIAVLPLESLGPDRQQEFLGDGITGQLIHELGKVRDLRVISRTSSMHYKGSDKALPEIAEELGVDAVVEGTVLADGDRVRVTTQLIRAATDEQLWSGRYERSLRDVIGMQREVAIEIAETVEAQLSGSERARLEAPKQIDPEAYRAFARGWMLFEQRTKEPDAIPAAVIALQGAIAREPEWAEAHAALAATYAVGSHYGVFDSVAGALAKARASGERALELAPSLGEANAALGFAALSSWDWDTAEAQFGHAARNAATGRAFSYSWGSIVHGVQGDPETAIEWAHKGFALDPLSSTTSLNLINAYRWARRLEEALLFAREAVEKRPGDHVAHLQLVAVLVEMGDLERAREVIEEGEAKDVSTNGLELRKACVLAQTGDTVHATEILERHLAAPPRHELAAMTIADLALCLGREELSAQLLREARVSRLPLLIYLGLPVFDRLRATAEGQLTARLVGLSLDTPREERRP